jgi:hypothetical protein
MTSRGGVRLDLSQIEVKTTTLNQLVTELAFGDLEYSLKFTDIDQDLYRAQLNNLRESLNYHGAKPLNTIDMTL